MTVTAANAPPTAQTVKSFMGDSSKAEVETKLETGASTTRVQRGASSANSSVDTSQGNLYKNYNSM